MISAPYLTVKSELAVDDGKGAGKSPDKVLIKSSRQLNTKNQP
jgi:hypothetical protein